MEKPNHLERFPCMGPWIGNSYRAPRFKRLLVVGESHYLPEKSTIHHDPNRWYRSKEENLTCEERAWVCTVGCISCVKRGQYYAGHRIYWNLKAELTEIMQENGLVASDGFPLDHIAYYNYFMRPAPTTGDSMKGHVEPIDCKVAEGVLRWFVQKHRPELVIFVSDFAGGFAESVIREYDILYIITPHPGSPWWNRAARKYARNRIYADNSPGKGKRRGRDLFRDFLMKHQWIATA